MIFYASDSTFVESKLQDQALTELVKQAVYKETWASIVNYKKLLTWT